MGFLRRALALGNLLGIASCTCFTIVGFYVMCHPLIRENGKTRHDVFLRVHWFMQGLIVAVLSAAIVMFMLCVNMAKDPNDETTWMGWTAKSMVRQFGYLQS